MSEADTVEHDARDRRIGHLLNEYLDLRARGRAEPQGQWLAKHPDLADELRSHLELVGGLQSERATLEGLIAQGLLEPCDDAAYPARLAEYKVSAVLGRGGMGIVLEAYEESLHRAVALKVLRPELADDQAALTRFTREARAAAALQHPNIVTVYAVGQHGPAHYLAMEYVDGPTLADTIRDGYPATPGVGPVFNRSDALVENQCHTAPPVAADLRVGRPADTRTVSSEVVAPHRPLPTDFIRDAFRQLLSALAAAHQAGLIHRDVKSSNILLDCGGWHGQSSIVNPQSSIVKLADFGLARMLSAKTRMTTAGSVLGTPEYMSPEQARGDENLDHRTDLYSAGVVLYEMLTGRTPFKADTPSAVIHRIIHEDPPDPRTINKTADLHLTSLALRLMAKQSEDRFDSATEVIAALDAGDRVVLFDKRRRRRRHWALGTALVVALLVGAGWLQSAQTITAVEIDDRDSSRLLVRRGFGLSMEEFHKFPEGVTATSAELVNPGGRERPLVFAALDKATGRNLVAFDADGEEVFGWYLSSDDQWPDCQLSQVWGCYALAVGDFDGDAGDEVVAVASDEHEYPTLISAIDPRAQEIRSSFRHLGDIAGVRLEPNFFADGGTAIIAWGANNKLDGFDAYPGGPEQRLPGDDTPVTDWDMVSVVMILDPATMEGLGPPQTNRLSGVPAAGLHAYAFLDLAHSEAAHRRPPGAQRRTPPSSDQIASITNVCKTAAPDEDIANLRFDIMVARGDGSGGARILVDRNLNVRNVKVNNAESHGRTPAYWRQRWHPIIQHGRYLDD